MKTIPTAIQIGPHEFKVTLIKGMQYKDKCYGRWNMDNMEIFIEEDMNIIKQIETLIHECMEIVCALNDVDVEHRDIYTISCGLTQALFKLPNTNGDK